MPLTLQNVQYSEGEVSLNVSLSIMEGVIVGVTGPGGVAPLRLLEIVGGLRSADGGRIDRPSSHSTAAESLQSADPRLVTKSIETTLDSGADLLIIGASLSLTDFRYQQHALVRLHELQRHGTIILLASHDLLLLERHCDEVLVLCDGRVAERGDPRLVLDSYRQQVQAKLCAAAGPATLSPSSRHGDGRAEVLDVRILDAAEKETTVVPSGASVAVRMRLRYGAAVADPVVGILIRTRVGVNVYGTNTKAENLSFGPCSPGEEVEVTFRFACRLCPQDYTVTVASHDPDGAAHEWLDDAVRFTVTDTRYTAGVANLGARVGVKRLTRTADPKPINES